tara:strand:+ start:215 stop:1096 length:882 start_codon:yes stop_codon:yes gene_type:complete
MKKIIIFLLLITTINVSATESSTIKVWKHTANKPGIIGPLLLQALDITKHEYGDYQIIYSNYMSQDRAFRELKNANLDIAHFVSTHQREKQIPPVYIPIMRGLLGYRLCLIKEDNQYKFNDVTTQQQWIEKGITIAQHRNWPDTNVLKSNGFKVQTTFKPELLLQQLSKNRFDCYARGLSEISSELETNVPLDITIEKNIVIFYPLPQFYFVNPKKPLLAERIHLGLTRLQKNGSSDQLFDTYYKDLLDKFYLKNRNLIELDNPTLSAKTLQAINIPITNLKKQLITDQNRKP